MKIFYIFIFVIFSNSASGESPEFFYISISEFANSPSPTITASRSDNRVRWFDDSPEAEHSHEFELGISLPREYLLALRFKQIEGSHFGEAARYQCFFRFCAWIGGSLINSLPSNDKITYEISMWQLWIEKSPFEAIPQLRFRGGVNIIDANLTLDGSGLQRNEQGILPLPMAGYAFSTALSSNWSFEIDSNFSKFDSNKGVISYRDTTAAIALKFKKNLTISAGIKKTNLDARYQDKFKIATLKVPQKTPFIKLTYQY